MLSKVLSREINVVDMRECCLHYIGYMFLHGHTLINKMNPRLRVELVMVITVLPMVRLIRSWGGKHDPITTHTGLSSFSIKKLITIHSSEMQLFTCSFFLIHYPIG